MTFGTLRSSPFILRNLQKFLMALALWPWLSIATAQPAPKVTFLVHDPPGVSPFWTQTIDIMKAAAEDLKIDLRFAYSRSNSYSLKKDGLAALNATDKPDYFLSGYWIST